MKRVWFIDHVEWVAKTAFPNMAEDSCSDSCTSDDTASVRKDNDKERLGKRCPILVNQQEIAGSGQDVNWEWEFLEEGLRRGFGITPLVQEVWFQLI